VTVRARLGDLARRIDDATPPHRDRAVDALRALAIAGVIGGHWLVTALVAGPGPLTHGQGGGTVLRDDSPLASMSYLTPVSWVFQTLAVFFLVGGYSAARGYRGGYASWLRRRLARLARPVAVLAAVWIPVTAGLCLAGTPAAAVRTLLTLVIDPLWFLGVYAALTALTPVGIRLVRRLGTAAAAVPAAVVAAADLVRFGLHGPGWVGWVNLPAGWLVPYLLGIAWALGSIGPAGSPRARRTPALLLAGGAAATAALIAWGGYPASMVGVNGARISNLNPPTLAAVAFGVTQCGLALLLRGPLSRWMRRPAAWAVVATANLSAMTLFLWHQTAFVTVCAVGLLAGRVPGLLTAPAGPAWIVERLAWLPAFAAVLAAAWLVFHRTERARPGTRRWPGLGRWSPRRRARYARRPGSSPAVTAGVRTMQPRRAR
jgi:peptidoglycan/LPS O-acetylase OafA/YrhL